MIPVPSIKQSWANKMSWKAQGFDSTSHGGAGHIKGSRSVLRMRVNDE